MFWTEHPGVVRLVDGLAPAKRLSLAVATDAAASTPAATTAQAIAVASRIRVAPAT